MRHRAAIPCTIALALVLSRADLSRACTCVEPSTQESFARAETVFVGTATNVSPDRSKTLRVISFNVHRVFKGKVPARFRLSTHMSAATCGYTFSPGSVYLVFTRHFSGEPFTGLCHGNRTLSSEHQLPTEFGPGSAPSQRPR